MLEEAILGMIAHGKDVPEPVPQKNAAGGGTHQAPVVLPAFTTVKLEPYLATRTAGLNEAQLAAGL